MGRRTWLVGTAVLLGVLVAGPPSGASTDPTAASTVPAASSTVPAASSTVPAAPTAPVTAVPSLLLFWGNGCPHCEAERRFLAGLQERHPDLVIETYEVWEHPDNRALFQKVAAEHGVDPQAVPTTFFGDRVWVGYSDATGAQIEAAVAAALEGAPPPAEDPDEAAIVDVPLVGSVDVGDRSLVVSTLIIGFVDGVNPCSLWVLSLLLALVLHSGSRQRVFAVGGMFLAITSALYATYIAGFYTALSYADALPWIQRGVALIALGLGALQLKDYVALHRGPSLSISDARKPELYRRMRSLAAPERPLPAVLLATAGLAVGVSLLETPCTAGLPMLWTRLLSNHGVGAAGTALLFVVYLSVFLLDELLVFGLAVVTMRAVKLQEHHGRALKLVSGAVMITLAVVLLTWPSVMDTVAGALTTFAVALEASGLVLLVERWLGRRRPAPTQTKRPPAPASRPLAPARRRPARTGPRGR